MSLSTVSRVMNGNTTVDPVLAERVRDAATELGYTANPLARSLVLGRTQTVAVVVPDLGNPTFQAILRGLSRAAAADGYHVLIADSAEYVAEERLLAVETRRRTDGLILCAPRMPDDELRALLAGVAPSCSSTGRRSTPRPAVRPTTAGAPRAPGAPARSRSPRASSTLPASRAASRTRRGSTRSRDFRAAHPDVDRHELRVGVDFDSGAPRPDAVLATGATAVLASTISSRWDC